MICAGGGHLRLRSGIPLTPAPTPRNDEGHPAGGPQVEWRSEARS